MDRYRIRSGERPELGSRDPRDKSAFADLKKATSVTVLAERRALLAELQQRLWADGSQALLVVLQAMDTGGKDGTIRRVFSGVNPQGVDVNGFGVPSNEEMDHDYLWRIHAHAPAKGRIAVFNRSHYEDVLVVRVNDLVPQSRWSRRYAHIRDFERMLTDEGTTIVKIMLHISPEEQKERLEARLVDPAKGYKFNPSDLDARAQWSDYMRAYEDALAETTSNAAPWFVVPADRKWIRNLVVAQILIEALQSMDLKYPEPEVDLTTIKIP
jgi:PPK2 family polyphosphate:nucleotide phosphotransferase